MSAAAVTAKPLTLQPRTSSGIKHDFHERAGKEDFASQNVASTEMEATRLCSVTLCKNVLEPGWAFARCAPCQLERVKRHGKVRNIPCHLCSAPVSISAGQASSGITFICSSCAQRRRTVPEAGVAMDAYFPRQTMLPAGRPARHHPGSSSHVLIMAPPPLMPYPLPAVPAAPSSIRSHSVHTPATITSVEEARGYIHPDHRYLLDRGDGPISTIPFYPIPPLFMLQHEVHKRRSFVGMPHYGSCGEILVPRPVGMQPQQTVAYPVPQQPYPPSIIQPAIFTQSGRTPEESIVIPDSPEPPPAAIVAKEALQPTHSSTPVQTEAINLPSLSAPLVSEQVNQSQDNAVDAPPPRKKRKSMLGHTRSSRICSTPGCGRAIPREFQGSLCVECGFSRWRDQFRERFTPLRIKLTMNKSKVVKEVDKSQAPVKTPMDVAEPSDSNTNVAQVESSDCKHTSEAQAGEPRVEYPTPRRSATFPMPLGGQVRYSELSRREAAETLNNDAMDVDPESSDDEPLASKLLHSVMLSSDDEPLAVKFGVPATSDDEPLAAVISGNVSSDEEPLFNVYNSRRASGASSPWISDSDSKSQEDAMDVDPSPESRIRLRIVLPPAKPAAASSSRVRRVRLLLGPRPPTPESSSASRDSSPERSSGSGSSPRHLRWHDWDSDESELTPLEDLTPLEESTDDDWDINQQINEDEPPEPTPVSFTMPSLAIPPQAKERPPTPPPKKHRGQCASIGCVNLLPIFCRYKFCHPCRTRNSLLRRHEKQMRRKQLGERDADLEIPDIKLPSDGDLTGYRTCSRQRCNRLIPPQEEYGYKRCPRCRRVSRRWKSKSRQKAFDLLNEQHGVLVNSQSMPETSLASGGGEKLADAPPYQHLASLLRAISARLSEFKVAQTRYVQLKALQGKDRKPMVFAFDGEYSIVADPTGGAVDGIAHSVIRSLSVALGLTFKPTCVTPGPEQSVTANLNCVYTAQIPSLSQKLEGVVEPTSETVADLLDLAMVGELQICIAWDRRHKYFPGQRVFVRFRLVG